MNNQENQAVEIDVFAMLKTLWKRKFSIVLVALVFAIAAFGYSAFLAKKEYQSTSRIYVVSRQNQDNNALTNSDLQAGSYLVKDYREIILSQNVLSQAIEELKLDMTPAELSKKISVSVPTDTRILSITAKDGDPKEAARIANGLRNVAAEKIISVTKVSDVTTLDEAEVPQSPSSPNIRRNVLLGFIAGAGLMVVLMVVVEVLDDRVKRPEDIEELMGLTLLGIVPDIKKL
ncbi:Wzz/FepE/Etk N-terminal domain-containing protein [Streptococcus parasanguinis]|uniref:Wzz/FepE/Etk N-terminal domain-containing protein n=1 Tax=Streptococcus parasanguinis TaxID=1318 RepID=UPI00319E669D